MKRLAIIPGDGIGPEVMAQAIPLLDWLCESGHELEWQIFEFGAERYLKTGLTLTNSEFDLIKDSFDAIIFGAVGDPRVPDNRHSEEILLRLRHDLELVVNFRSCFPLLEELIPIKGKNCDDIKVEFFRENTEGPYIMQGESFVDRAIDLALHTKTAVEILLHEAFQRAKKRNCQLHLAHKANVIKHGHGLWMRVFHDIKAHYPEVDAKDIHADALMCALLVDPSQFGVIAGDNLIGDLASDLLAALQGGMGMAPSVSYAPERFKNQSTGKSFRCKALFEPVHGSAPSLAGTGKANPLGMIQCIAMFCEHYGYPKESERILGAVRDALLEGFKTPDLGGYHNTESVGRAVREKLGLANPAGPS